MPFVWTSCYLRPDISQSNEKEMWEWKEKQKQHSSKLKADSYYSPSDMKEYYLGNSYLMPGLGSSALSFNYITLFFFLSPPLYYIISACTNTVPTWECNSVSWCFPNQKATWRHINIIQGNHRPWDRKKSFVFRMPVYPSSVSQHMKSWIIINGLFPPQMYNVLLYDLAVVPHCILIHIFQKNFNLGKQYLGKKLRRHKN